MKYCPCCDTVKKEEEFHKNKGRPDGLRSSCKVCATEKSRKYRERNRETYLGSLRRYREKNPEYFTNWRKLNRDKNAKKQMTRELLKAKATPTWLTKEQHEEILQFYWLAKDLRSVSGQDYHVDHIVPINSDIVCGLHVPWNLQVLPSDVNISKGNKLL